MMNFKKISLLLIIVGLLTSCNSPSYVTLKQKIVNGECTLRTGASVMFNGMKIGEVEEVKLKEQSLFYSILIKEDISFYEGTEFLIENNNLLLPDYYLRVSDIKMKGTSSIKIHEVFCNSVSLFEQLKLKQRFDKIDSLTPLVRAQNE